MGPPLFSDGDSVDAISFSSEFTELQWGRRSSATETTQDLRGITEVDVASMGPPLFSDGDSKPRKDRDGKGWSFNGAAALQRRRRSL